jgi:[ribosomal protein S5]-alanine N-acetyltransferase
MLDRTGPWRPANGLGPLATDRLILRVPSLADAAAMARFVGENRSHLEPWESVRNAAYFTANHWETRFQILRERMTEGRAVDFLLRQRDTPEGPVIGRVSFTNIIHGVFQCATLGYCLDHREVGRGLMSEALRECIRFCFRDLNLHRIQAAYMPANQRSARVLERLGFVPEGLAKDYLLLAGKWQDHVLTSLVNPEWRGD